MTQQTGHPRTVFISYCSRDQAVAETICRHLEGCGLHCWIAPRNLKAGEVYAEGLIEGINGSHALVVVLSEAANHSSHVQREVERAASKGLRIIVVRTEDVQPAPALEYFVSGVQWLDTFAGPRDAYLEHLYESVRPEGQAGAGLPAADVSAKEAARPAQAGVKHSASARRFRLAAATVFCVLMGAGLTALTRAILLVPAIAVAGLILSLMTRLGTDRRRSSLFTAGTLAFYGSVALTLGWIIAAVWLPQRLHAFYVKHSGQYVWSEAVDSTRSGAADQARFNLVADLLRASGQSPAPEVVNSLAAGFDKSACLGVEPLGEFRTISLIQMAAGGLPHALAYLQNNNVVRVAKRQKDLMRRWIQEGEQAERNREISVALCRYYCAYLMAHALVDTMALETDSRGRSSPQRILYDRIHGVLARLKAAAVSSQEDDGYLNASLWFEYGLEPVRSLCFRYQASADCTLTRCVADGQPVAVRFRCGISPPCAETVLHVEYDCGRDRVPPALLRLGDVLKSPEFSSELTVFIPRTPGRDMPTPQASVLTSDSATYRHLEVLAGISSAEDFLATLRIYERNHRLTVLKEPPSNPSAGPSFFAAVLDPARVRAVLQYHGTSYRDITTHQEYFELADTFQGCRIIWIGHGERP